MNAELFQLDARRIGIISEVLADLLESLLEQVVDVLSRQCRRLEVLQAVVLCVFLSLVIGDLSGSLVTFVANNVEELVGVFIFVIKVLDEIFKFSE